jgi:hypothetical protein
MVDVAGGLRNRGSYGPRSGSRPGVPASGRQLRAAASARSASSCPLGSCLTSRLSRIASDAMRCRLPPTCAKSLALCRGDSPSCVLSFEPPRAKTTSGSYGAVVVSCTGIHPGPPRLDSRFGECLDCPRIVDPASGRSSERHAPGYGRLAMTSSPARVLSHLNRPARIFESS